jgi:hypothetical protein
MTVTARIMAVMLVAVIAVIMTVMAWVAVMRVMVAVPEACAGHAPSVPEKSYCSTSTRASRAQMRKHGSRAGAGFHSGPTPECTMRVRGCGAAASARQRTGLTVAR